MASNPFQFQPGMPLPDFIRYFGIEARCADSLARTRWPDGIARPGCSATAHCVVNRNTKALFQCNACRHQTSITAGTPVASTKLPLTTWFLAIYLNSARYLGAFAYRFNHRFNLADLVIRLLAYAARAPASPQRVSRKADPHCKSR